MSKNPAAPKAYRGFEIFTSELRMTFRMYTTILKVCVLLQCFYIFMMYDVALPTKWEREYFFKLAYCAAMSMTSPENETTLTMWEPDTKKGIPENLSKEEQQSFEPEVYETDVVSLLEYLRGDYFTDILKWVMIKFFGMIASSFLIYGLFFIMIRNFKESAKLQKAKIHVKGARLVSDTELAKMLEKEFKPKNKKKISMNDGLDLPFGQLRLPREFEVQHVFFCGAPGTGKTVFQSQVIARILERGDPAIIYDLKGDFVAKFYDPKKDHLFNPMDTRCFKWNIFNDIQYDHDIDAVAGSVIPKDGGSDPFWNMAAGGLFAGIIRACVYHGRMTNYELDAMMRLPLPQLLELLKEVPGNEKAIKPIADPEGKMAGSVMGVMSQYTKAFEVMKDMDGDFSVEEWCENPKGNIFISNLTALQETLSPVLTLFINLMARKCCQWRTIGSAGGLYFWMNLVRCKRFSRLFICSPLAGQKAYLFGLGYRISGRFFSGHVSFV